MTTISTLPTPPSRDDPTNFSARGDAFFGALPTFVTEVNTVAGEVSTNAAGASSSAGTATTQAGISTTQAGIATIKAGEAAASAVAAADYAASLPAGSINDSLIDSTHTYSSTKLVATFGQLVAANTWTGAQTYTCPIIEPPAAANVSGSYTLPDRSFHDLTMTGNVTFAFPAAVYGKQFTMWLRQDATGSRVPTFPASIRPGSGVTYVPTATAGKTDTLTFICDGTYWLLYVGGKNATRA